MLVGMVINSNRVGKLMLDLEIADLWSLVFFEHWLLLERTVEREAQSPANSSMNNQSHDNHFPHMIT